MWIIASRWRRKEIWKILFVCLFNYHCERKKKEDFYVTWNINVSGFYLQGFIILIKAQAGPSQDILLPGAQQIIYKLSLSKKQNEVLPVFILPLGISHIIWPWFHSLYQYCTLWIAERKSLTFMWPTLPDPIHQQVAFKQANKKTDDRWLSYSESYTLIVHLRCEFKRHDCKGYVI